MSLMTKAKHLITGESAERQACQFLEREHYRLLKKNFRCKFGEIDLIMQNGQNLVFVEVRYRKHDNFGSGAESVTQSKQNKLINTAKYYLQKNPNAAQYACRFDVISMSPSESSNNSEIDWIKDAFQA